jgi:hypothetical protein
MWDFKKGLLRGHRQKILLNNTQLFIRIQKSRAATRPVIGEEKKRKSEREHLKMREEKKLRGGGYGLFKRSCCTIPSFFSGFKRAARPPVQLPTMLMCTDTQSSSGADVIVKGCHSCCAMYLFRSNHLFIAVFCILL